MRTRLERHKYCVARSREKCFSLQICFALFRPVFLCFAIELLLSQLSPLQLLHLPLGCSPAMPCQVAPSANFVHLLQQNDVVGQPLSEGEGKLDRVFFWSSLRGWPTVELALRCAVSRRFGHRILVVSSELPA